MQLSRRVVLGSVLGGIGAKAMGWPVLDGSTPIAGKRPKNIIFCVVDGMPISSMTAVDHLRQLQDGKRSYWAWLYDQPFAHNGLQDTRSLNSVVTDSSAASSSWGSGRHIWNGMVNMFPDETELRTLTSLMSEKGVKCGLVTTATITHATPAGFAVNCVQRDLEATIAEKYLHAGVDVLMGGGDRFFNASKRKDGKDLYGEFAKSGFKVVKDRASMLAQNEPKVLGIFGSSHVTYTIDRNNSEDLQRDVPTLAEMATKAIQTLKKSGSKNGFLLQIEGARVDHGGHANDAGALLHDQMAFEDAVRVAIEFAMEDKETLVIITADHACGGMALNGAGDEYSDSTGGLQTILKMKSSLTPVMVAIGTAPTPEKVRDAVEHMLSVQLTTAESEAWAKSMKGEHAFGASEFFRSSNATAGMLLGNHTKLTFTSGNHHSDHVLVTAYGPGSEKCTGLTQNIEFFDLMCGFKGIHHQNPTMTLAEAAPLYEKLQKKLNPLTVEAHEDDDCADHNYQPLRRA